MGQINVRDDMQKGLISKIQRSQHFFCGKISMFLTNQALQKRQPRGPNIYYLKQDQYTEKAKQFFDSSKAIVHECEELRQKVFSGQLKSSQYEILIKRQIDDFFEARVKFKEKLINLVQGEDSESGKRIEQFILYLTNNFVDYLSKSAICMEGYTYGGFQQFLDEQFSELINILAKSLSKSQLSLKPDTS